MWPLACWPQSGQPDSALVQQQQSAATQWAAQAEVLRSIDRQLAALRRQPGALAAPPTEKPFFVLSTTAVRTPPPTCEPLSPSDLRPLIERASAAEGVPNALIAAIIEKESGFRPCAVSPKGAMGLMQLMPATAARFGVTDPFDPESSINAGTRFIRELLLRYNGNLALALGAYNAGPGRVDESGGVPAIRETQDYVRDILRKLP